MYYDDQAQWGRPDSGPPQYPVPPNLQLARAYVLNQPYTQIFPPEEALYQGTLFPELVRPYTKKC